MTDAVDKPAGESFRDFIGDAVRAQAEYFRALAAQREGRLEFMSTKDRERAEYVLGLRDSFSLSDSAAVCIACGRKHAPACTPASRDTRADFGHR